MIDFSVQIAVTHTQAIVPRIGLVYQRPRSVAFVRAHGAYGMASQRAWDVMLSWINERGLLLQLPYGYGLAYDNPRRTAQGQCPYEACVELPDSYVELPTDGICFQTLPGGAYARTRHVGPYSGLRHSVVRIRDTWLTEQTHLTIDRRRPFMFTYLDAPGSCEPEELRTDVCIPVRAPSDDVFPRIKMSEPFDA